MMAFRFCGYLAWKVARYHAWVCTAVNERLRIAMATVSHSGPGLEPCATSAMPTYRTISARKCGHDTYSNQSPHGRE